MVTNLMHIIEGDLNAWKPILCIYCGRRLERMKIKSMKFKRKETYSCKQSYPFIMEGGERMENNVAPFKWGRLGKKS